MKKKLTQEQMEELRMVYILSNEFSREFKQEHFTDILDEAYVKANVSMRELAKDYGISKATVSRIVANYLAEFKRKHNGY